jgi:hypothetical protein
VCGDEQRERDRDFGGREAKREGQRVHGRGLAITV